MSTWEGAALGKPGEPYLSVEVESYKPTNSSGLHGEIHVRPVAGQGYAENLHVRCPKTLSQDYPVGTRFRITAKLTDRVGGGEFLHTHHNWPFEVLGKPKPKS
jgi:hypothetical protein